ncbi:aminotransferase class V-fold PLP-dependent enzyme [Bacillus clarus]|uniref:cysteine desulfurase n=1 Tax=Bacillus clarus TaxID=2338372 RepID=A0A090YX02_9BACI|nr:aminotransferase class V-fold PLP-dependent enzyme [Bacillus clarus]KFN02892.1 cys/Met metabolism PLP-dependent enzyme family protein [Bacillus clarus]RFT64897.1 aminotransferase class V-fold PLP-dependent enzyme [Bacillus clarus]
MYLDNASTSWPKPEVIVQQMNNYMNLIGASPSRSGYKAALKSEELVLEARDNLSKLLCIKYPTQLIFTLNATEAINTAIFGILNLGDHVITTVIEHNSVLRPLWKLKENGFIDLTVVECDNTGLINHTEIENSIKKNTKLIAINHVSNVTGTIQPVEKIGEISKRNNIPFLLDISQSAGHIPIDISKIRADLVAFSGHKGLFGPTGTGALYISPELSVSPLKVGGTGILSEILDQPEAMPNKYESGTINTVGIVGLGAGVNFLMETNLEKVAKHEKLLFDLLMKELSPLENLTIYNNAFHNTGLFSFNINNLLPGRIGYLLDTVYDIQVRTGLHCAPLIHNRIGSGTNGTVRISPGYFNTVDEIKGCIEAIVEIHNATADVTALKIPIQQ